MALVVGVVGPVQRIGDPARATSLAGACGPGAPWAAAAMLKVSGYMKWKVPPLLLAWTVLKPGPR